MSAHALLLALDLLLRIVASALLGAGLLLLLFPAWTRVRLGVFTDERLLPKASGVSVDRWFYRHHRALGGAIALAGVYLLGFLAFQFSPLALSAFLDAAIDDARVRGDVVTVLHWLLFLGALLAYSVGLMLVIRPSALKPLESWMHAPVPLPAWPKLLASPGRVRLLGGASCGLGVALWVLV